MGLVPSYKLKAENIPHSEMEYKSRHMTIRTLEMSFLVENLFKIDFISWLVQQNNFHA